jgi:hypothetical protein
MTRTDIRDHFSRNKRRHDIDNALARLAHADMIECRRDASTNRPMVETWLPNIDHGNQLPGGRFKTVPSPVDSDSVATPQIPGPLPLSDTEPLEL